MPLTNPLELPMVATPVFVLVHTPPGTLLPNVDVSPIHTFRLPVIAPGLGLTVTTVVRLQPEGKEYVMIDVPAISPFTIPVVEPMVATAVLLLVQFPPDTVLPSDVVSPIHTLVAPVIAVGVGCTVTTLVTKQLGPVAYVITAVPAATPVTVPPTIVAVPVQQLVQTPPGVRSARITKPPTHILLPPVMAAGAGVTVTARVAKQPAAIE